MDEGELKEVAISLAKSAPQVVLTEWSHTVYSVAGCEESRRYLILVVEVALLLQQLLLSPDGLQPLLAPTWGGCIERDFVSVSSHLGECDWKIPLGGVCNVVFGAWKQAGRRPLRDTHGRKNFVHLFDMEKL